MNTKFKLLDLVWSFLISLYIIYMLNYFKTKYNIAHPKSYFKESYIYHPIKDTKEPRHMICRLGNDGSWIIALLIILRASILYSKSNIVSHSTLRLLSKCMFFIVLTLSFMNFNAVVYLIPYFLYEIFIMDIFN